MASLLLSCRKTPDMQQSTGLSKVKVFNNLLHGKWYNTGFYNNLSVEFNPNIMYLWGTYYPYYISTDTVFSPPNPLWKFRILTPDKITLTPISPTGPSPRPPDTFYRVK